MTRLAILGTSLLLALSLPASSAEQPLSPKATESYQKLVTALRAETGPKAKGEGLAKKKELLAALTRSSTQPEALDSNLAQVATVFTTDASKAAAGKLQALLQEEVKNSLPVKLKEMQDRLQSAKDAVLAARSPSDLDATMEALAPLSNMEDIVSEHPEIREMKERLLNAESFAGRWQNYLYAGSLGHTGEAATILKSLLDSHSDQSLIPLSKLMEIYSAHIITTEQAVRIVSEIKSLDEIREVLAGLNGRRIADGGAGTGVDSLIRSLDTLEKTYRAHLSGLPVAFDPSTLSVDTNIAAAPKLYELKGQLIKLTLPRQLAIPPDLAPRGDEDLSAFLDRVIQEAAARGDAALALRTREAKGRISGSDRSLPADTTGVAAYLAAQNQAAAGQFYLAVLSYQQALKSGSDLVSPKIVSERLEKIRTEHPEDFQRGSDLFVQSLLPAPRIPAEPIAAPAPTSPTPPTVAPAPPQPEPKPAEPAPAPEAPEPAPGD